MSEVYEFSIPANTLIAAPIKKVYNFFLQEETKITVKIPLGPQGLAGVRIETASGQVIPADHGTWLRGDGDVFGPYVFRAPGPPWYLILFGYNTDISYPHTFFIFID